MSRDACLQCFWKHLGKAAALLAEVPLGYPAHAILAIGELAEAEDEICRMNQVLAMTVREHRVAYGKSLLAAFTLDEETQRVIVHADKLHPIPCAELIETSVKLHLRGHLTA